MFDFLLPPGIKGLSKKKALAQFFLAEGIDISKQKGSLLDQLTMEGKFIQTFQQFLQASSKIS